MLTTPRAAVLASLHPTARLSRPWIISATVAMAAIPLVVTIVRSGDLTAPTVLLGLTAGASVGWAVEDPAAELLAPLPIGAPFRLLVRLVVGASIACLLVGVTAGMVAVGPGLTSDTTDRLPEVLAAGSVAVAAGLLTAGHGDRVVGAGAVTSGLLVTGLVATLAVRWPSQFPTFMASDVHHRWWWLALVAAALSARLARDQGRR